MTDAKPEVLTLIKLKHRSPKTRINPCLIYLSRLEKMCIESTDEHIGAHGCAGSSYEFCTKSGMALRYDVQKEIDLRWTRSQMHKIKSNMQNPRKSQFFVQARAL